MRDRLLNLAKRLFVVLVVFVPSGVAFTFVAVEVSSQPRFCGSCHIMKPYYESWQHSSHKDVACVECHIPPGVQSEVRKKYEALSMVTSYFTGTYGTRPWAEVADESCLRSGCHAKRILLGRELYQGSLFDHQPHLAEMRRGKMLRCTSCHSQIVQGSHIAVTSSSCFLCHFKNTPLNQGTGRCTICHQVPDKTITTAGLSFNHGDVRRFNMDCAHCHEGVIRGNGEVPRERCYSCHNEAERVERYGETETLHRVHVTEHVVTCLDCHIEIQHKIPAREEAIAAACASCHSPAAGHSAVRDLYRGIGAHGVTPRPAPMYLAGIRCEACHNQPRNGHSTASDISCMACHGPRYLTVYRSWTAGLRHRMEGITEELRAAKAALEQAGRTERDGLGDTEENIALLHDGKGIHNPGYAVDILKLAHENMVAVVADAGGALPAAPPWLEAPYSIECLSCHFGIEYLTGPAFDQQFPHGPHTVSARLRCTTCHGDMQNHGTLKLTEDRCADCHNRITQPMANVAPEECLTCHAAALGPVSDAVRFPHETHIAIGLGCEMCHDGVAKKPHRDFARSGKAVPALDHAFCRTCHANDVPDQEGIPPDGANCQRCHENF